MRWTALDWSRNWGKEALDLPQKGGELPKNLQNHPGGKSLQGGMTGIIWISTLVHHQPRIDFRGMPPQIFGEQLMFEVHHMRNVDHVPPFAYSIDCCGEGEAQMVPLRWWPPKGPFAVNGDHKAPGG